MNCLSRFLAFCLLTFTISCEDSIPAIDISEQDINFSLYGYFLTGTETTYVRVIPYRETLARPAPALMNAEVVSEDLQLGLKVQWNDSLVRNRDGSFSNVFWSSDLQVRQDRRYSFTVNRFDGKQTHAIVHVPPKPHSFRLDEPYKDGGYKQNIEWKTKATTTFIANVVYFVQTRNPGSPVIEISFPYLDFLERNAGTWSTELDLHGQSMSVKNQLREIISFGPGTKIILYQIQLYLVVPHSSWNPPGGYNPYALSQPGAFSNVENGYGFIGGAADTTFTWQLPGDVLEDLNFVSPQ